MFRTNMCEEAAGTNPLDFVFVSHYVASFAVHSLMRFSKQKHSHHDGPDYSAISKLIVDVMGSIANIPPFSINTDVGTKPKMIYVSIITPKFIAFANVVYFSCDSLNVVPNVW